MWNWKVKPFTDEGDRCSDVDSETSAVLSVLDFPRRECATLCRSVAISAQNTSSGFHRFSLLLSWYRPHAVLSVAVALLLGAVVTAE